ncbi:hypothetical protein EDM00_01685 [Ornithobacterium rhinotracheale]|uniref:hypothetical protein n=1 Tax=Ornithobacterium rhinotracheale TaxID=28251 RepID=UPI00129C37A2|nr:hypothetical protein [Ornithobacterium rhinotracheale]MRI62713.1 hypothetical protein [Ornithobacterium rhinotracheale]MRJ09709.1 hypothetical protein [Ornithobacterium rhinotracheale]
MKKYMLALAALMLVTGCNNDDSPNNNNTEQPVANKEIKIKSIQLTQGDTPIENPINDGVITLESRKPYRLEFTTEEPVNFIPGDFLKVKQASDTEFFADFYGSNLKDINEVITLKKDGYKDLIITIKQAAVKADYYKKANTLNGWGGLNLNPNVLITDPEGKILKITNVVPESMAEENPFNAMIPLEVEFISEVFLENMKINDYDEFNLLKVEARGDYSEELNAPKRNKYQLTIDSSPFRKDPNFTFKIPIYTLNENREKGEKLGEILVEGTKTPNLPVQRDITGNPWSEYRYKTDFDVIKYNIYDENIAEEIDNIKFYVQGIVTPVVIENINSNYIESVTPYLDESEGKATWKYRIKMNKQSVEEDKRNRNFNMEFKGFDVYAGEIKNGEIVKRKDAEKREIKISYNF